MSIIFFLWFWSMELIAISTLAITASIFFKLFENKQEDNEIQE